MITLIVGTPDSGKSRLAEQIAVENAGEGPRYYLATMIPFGEEGQKRVEKHRKMREGKGFVTLEWPSNLESRLDGSLDFADATVLLECMSNLVGNEMYGEEGKKLSMDQLLRKIIESIRLFGEKTKQLILVTNEFPLEDEQYDEETRAYVRLVAHVNEELCLLADTVWRHRKGTWYRDDNP